MNRRVHIQIMVSGLLLFTLMFAPSSGTDVQAQESLSAGCEEAQQVFGPSTFIFSGASTSTTGEFVDGEAITLRAELDSGATPSNVSFTMTGASGTLNASGNVANFSTTVAGNHTITVTNNEAATIIVTGSCVPRPVLIVIVDSPPAIPPWEGYTDGRLNPDPAEVYSVWCEFDNLVIYYQVDGVTRQANAYPMNALTDLSVGSTTVITDQTTGENLEIVRYSRDRYEIFGPRGNKFFRIDLCFDDLVVPAPPGDIDADGFPDNQDGCPNWTGFAFLGCPDTDSDGLIDPADRCPVIAGPQEFNGCPPDNPNADKDGDGIINFFDGCPEFATPEGVVDRGGCPDWDNDGVVNSPKRNYNEGDHCPLDAGNILNNGCPGNSPMLTLRNEIEADQSSISIYEYAEQTGNFNNILVAVNTRETTCIITSTSFLVCDPTFRD